MQVAPYVHVSMPWKLLLANFMCCLVVTRDDCLQRDIAIILKVTAIYISRSVLTSDWSTFIIAAVTSGAVIKSDQSQLMSDQSRLMSDQSRLDVQVQRVHRRDTKLFVDNTVTVTDL